MQASQVHPHQTVSHVFLALVLCTGAVMLEEEGASSKLVPQSWECGFVARAAPYHRSTLEFSDLLRATCFHKCLEKQPACQGA